jgi:starch synthase
MISYKYATVPIVHHTGGLVDTVKDIEEKGGGFVFYNYTTEDLITAVERAQELFEKKGEWLKLIKKITRYNFSWQITANQYIEMYKKTLSL